MKEIIHNGDNLKETDINNKIKRAKMIVENSKEELLLVYSHNNYFLIGGHVDDGEDFDECIVREIKEESGVDIPFKKRVPFMSIKYFCRDYPKDGLNTKYTNNYYSIKYDLVPDLNNTNLTGDELDGNFKLVYINKNNILKELKKSLKTATLENVVLDTIEVVKEYLKSQK